MSLKNKIKIAILFISLITILGQGKVVAGKRYWIGNGTNVNWNTTANWSTLSGGVSGASVPGSSDSVYYDDKGTGQCSVNATVNVKRFQIGSGYTDTIKQNAYAMTIGTSGMILDGGTFKGGSLNITDQGIFTLAGSNFISTSLILSITGNYTFSSGTFSHNNGEVKFVATATINGNTTFFKLTFAPTTVSTFTISSGITLTVTDLFKTTGGSTMVVNTGNIDAKGDITLSNTYNNSTSSGNATLNITGTGKQILTGSASIVQGRLWNVNINKASDTLVLKNIVNVGGNWTYTSGIIDASTFSSTVCFCYSNKTIAGKHSLYNVDFYCPTVVTSTINTGDTLSVLGSLTIQGNSMNILNTGVINLKGDLTITNTALSSSGGTATIYFSGTGNQTIFGASTDLAGRLCNVKINKSSGNLILKDKITIGPSRSWKLLQGNLDVSTYDSEVILGHGTVALEGNQTFKNLTFTSETDGHSLLNIPVNDTITVNGELRFEGTIYYALLNTGNIHAKGDITITNTSTVNNSPTAVIKICGTGNQTITGTAIPLLGKLPNVNIDKPSGTLILKDAVSIGSGCSWKLLNGTIDAITYSSTLAFNRNTHSIEGSQTLNNLLLSAWSSTGTYNIPSTDTISVNGELKTEGTSFLSINNGTINAKGDITVDNTFVGTGTTASSTINICGTGTQNFTGSGIALAGKLCNIKVNKPSGTLNLSSIISAEENWDYVRGNVNAGTSTVVFNGGSYASVNTVGNSSTMNFHNLTTFSTVILNSNLTCTGNLTISSSSTLNGNGKAISIAGNWDNTGTFTFANTNITLNGSGRQRIIKASGSVNFYDLTINKSNQKVLFGAPVIINNNLLLTKGIIGTTSTNILTLLNNKICSGGSDSSFVCGPVKKTGDDTFIYPLGDTTLSTGAFHPLEITAPTDSSDAFTAQFFASNQTYGSNFQTDSLESISNCEYWLLTRNVGTSNVIPTIGWNSNSCNIESYGDLAVAHWDAIASQWKSLGRSQFYVDEERGGVMASTPITATLNPILIAKTISRDPCAILKRELDGGYFISKDGKLNFTYNEEYNDTDGKLTFNIYDDLNQLKTSNTLMPTGLRPSVKYGYNRYSLNLLHYLFTPDGRLPVNMFFILEVINDKNEKQYLRFYNKACYNFFFFYPCP